MPFTGLTKAERSNLSLEVVPGRARLRLTRLLRARVDVGPNAIIHMNRAINIARTVLGLPIHVLEGDDWGEYEPAVYAWHVGELELVMRRADTPELAETLADLVKAGALDPKEVNTVLKEENVSFRVRATEHHDDEVTDVAVKIFAPAEIPQAEMAGEHPNIRALVSRMDVLVEQKDAPGVLHAAACIFEALAKDVVQIPSVQDQTLASFFERYRKDSLLPEPILDYILGVYKKRNSEPLAGHGQLAEPTLTPQEAVALAEITKAFVRIERKLALVEISPEAKRASAGRTKPASAGRAREGGAGATDDEEGDRL